MRTVLTIGTFDVPHLGHAFLLRHAAAMGDRLVVGINSDRFVRSFKSNPLYLWVERAQMMRQLGYEVRANDGPGHNLIEEVRPHVLAIGMDWLPPKDYLAQIATTPQELSEWGVTLAFIPLMALGDGKVSSSEIKERAGG